MKKIVYSLLIVVFVAAMMLTGWQPAQAQQPFSANGWITILWGDGPKGQSVTAYQFTDDNGQTSTLTMDAALAEPLGGLLALDRQRVSISGIRRVSAMAEGGAANLQVESVAFENPPAEGVSGTSVTGSQPFITIMCKFKDVADEPKALPYFENMYSNVYPGLDDYWQEVSYNTANVAGSDALGWYTLPHDRSYYFDGTSWSFSRSAADCTQLADAAVNFTSFKGINLMFNDDLDGFAWGGGQCLTLDGVSQCWSMTWEPPWAYEAITVISHEMGHALGLPHSSGNYGATYDNQWDVMSDNWTTCSRSTDPTYGCLGQHTISYHKDRLGWIPAAKKFTAWGNVNTTITLEQLSLPTTSNYLMVKIPIGGSSTHFYTVEARRQTGYDVKLPGQGVIIHDVDLLRSDGRPAHVIDIDNNNNTGDAGAIWAVGERFSDTANGIFVKVVAATATGFSVSIQTPAVLSSTAANDGWALESGETTNVGAAALNSAATTFRLGDDALNRQFRSILHFDTSTLPDNAVITRVRLKIMKQALVGTDPFTTHGALLADIRKPFFGASVGLEAIDFQAGANANTAALFGATPSGSWYLATLNAANHPFINLTGSTQFRLRFNKDDNNDLGADYVSFYSGNDATTTNRPQLVIQYYVP